MWNSVPDTSTLRSPITAVDYSYYRELASIWRSTFFLQSSCLCVWVPAVWLGRLRECAWKWLGPAMTLQFWWGRRLPSYSGNVRMHVFSFPVLVTTSVSFPVSLHFLWVFCFVFCFLLLPTAVLPTESSLHLPRKKTDYWSGRGREVGEEKESGWENRREIWIWECVEV